MKKLLLAVLALTLGISTQAQIVSSSSSKVEVVETPKVQKPVRKTQWYLRGGLNVMTLAGGEETLDSRIGYDLSMGFQKPMGSAGLFWGMEWGLSSRGYSYSEDGYEDKLIAHNMKYVPFDFGYKYAFSNGFKLYAHTNVFMSIDYIGTNEYDEWNGRRSVKVEDSIWDIDDYMPLDAGMQLGVGLWWKRLNVDLTYQFGFIDMSTGDYSAGCSRNFMVRVGFGF